MKKVFTLFVLTALGISILAQAPQKMSYQAIIRDAEDSLITNSVIGMQISILQDHPSGTPVYVETHTPETNVNGMISLKIGVGTPVTGIFSDIDWSASNYYLKTEVDPEGGTNYTITGTSQLLSVPYAFYADKSGSSSGGPTQDQHYIGEFYQGGIIFYVDETGEHGLICSLIDLNETTQAWSNIIDAYIGPTARSSYNGQGNTDAIIGQEGHTASAAKNCDDYTNEDYGTGTYSDWYLPAIDEVNLIYNSKYQINKALDNDNNEDTKLLSLNNYWSSTENNLGASWVFKFGSGETMSSGKQNAFYVRAVRAF